MARGGYFGMTPVAVARDARFCASGSAARHEGDSFSTLALRQARDARAARLDTVTETVVIALADLSQAHGLVLHFRRHLRLGSSDGCPRCADNGRNNDGSGKRHADRTLL